MKTIHYEMIMSGGVDGLNNYIISNSDINDVVPEEGNSHNPGIKMTVEECKSPEKIFSSFVYVEIDKENSNFRNHYMQLLRGEYASWKLVAVEVTHRRLWLTFQNEELEDMYLKNAAENISDENDLPYYKESLEFILPSSSEGESGHVKFKFEVLQPESLKPDITTVSFSNTGSTVITEYGDDKRREICLPGQEVHGIGDIPYMLVPVTEYYR